jgi:hypothetical protein
MKNHKYVLRRWTPERGDRDIMYGHDLDILDELAIDMNQSVGPGDERHYHAESIETPLMMPAGDTNQ